LKSVFGPDDIRVLVRAFEEAWSAVAQTTLSFGSDEDRDTAREGLAKYIMDRARRGEGDARRLRDGAVLHCARFSASVAARPDGGGSLSARAALHARPGPKWREARAGRGIIELVQASGSHQPVENDRETMERRSKPLRSICCSLMQILHDEFADSKFQPCPMLKKLVAAGHLDRNSGRGVLG